MEFLALILAGVALHQMSELRRKLRRTEDHIEEFKRLVAESDQRLTDNEDILVDMGERLDSMELLLRQVRSGRQGEGS